MAEDNGAPFKVTVTNISCPFDCPRVLPIEIGWVNHEAPTLHVNAPDLINHLRAEHHHN